MADNIKILALDPSSKCTGYCVMAADQSLIEAGKLSPGKTRDDAAIRIAAMCGSLTELLGQTEPDIIVIEWTTGKVGRRRHKGGGSGLAIYGIAIGAIWQTAGLWLRDKDIPHTPRSVVRIDENVWTGGRLKRKRAEIIARVYPAYDPANDTGGDIADAIGLARYYCRQKFIVENLQ